MSVHSASKLLMFEVLPTQVLDAPALQDDFYLNLVDWSAQNVLAVGLGTCVYLWSACTSKVIPIAKLVQLQAVPTGDFLPFQRFIFMSCCKQLFITPHFPCHVSVFYRAEGRHFFPRMVLPDPLRGGHGCVARR